MPMTTEQRLIALVTEIGPDIKALKTADGDLSLLTTAQKTNLVGALNEVHALATANSPLSLIDDNAGDGNSDKVWSADKAFSALNEAIIALRNELRGGAGAALDTFAEVAAAMAADDTVAAALADAVAKRVRFDAPQALSVAEKAQARDNIGAASAADLTALTAALGNTDVDLLALYNAAKA